MADPWALPGGSAIFTENQGFSSFLPGEESHGSEPGLLLTVLCLPEALSAADNGEQSAGAWYAGSHPPVFLYFL